VCADDDAGECTALARHHNRVPDADDAEAVDRAPTQSRAAVWAMVVEEVEEMVVEVGLVREVVRQVARQ
jgi:hypothetical protein